MKSMRPFSVTLLALIVLSLSALNLIRFGAAIAQWEVLAEFAPRPGPLYILLTGLLWAIIGFPVYWSLWLNRLASYRVALPVSLGYAGYYWLDRLLLQVRPTQSNWPVALGITIVLLFLATFVTFHPRIRNFPQRETHDR